MGPTWTRWYTRILRYTTCPICRWTTPTSASTNQKKSVICVGQGPWELPHYTRQLDSILKARGIKTWVDYWGYDCSHDWPWWYKQVEYFVPYLLS